MPRPLSCTTRIPAPPDKGVSEPNSHLTQTPPRAQAGAGSGLFPTFRRAGVISRAAWCGGRAARVREGPRLRQGYGGQAVSGVAAARRGHEFCAADRPARPRPSRTEDEDEDEGRGKEPGPQSSTAIVAPYRRTKDTRKDRPRQGTERQPRALGRRARTTRLRASRFGAAGESGRRVRTTDHESLRPFPFSVSAFQRFSFFPPGPPPARSPRESSPGMPASRP